MNVWIWTLSSVALVSLISLIGVFTLSLNKETLKGLLLYLVSFAVGGLFGDALIHLIPESFKSLESSLTVSICIILGILVFFILERFLRWRHCHIPASHEHVHPVTTINLIGSAFHNFIDGMIIGASFCVSVPLGITTTLAVVLHEIPQEIGHFGILVHGGFPVKKALLFNFLSALTAFAGAVVALSLGPNAGTFRLYLLPITAGGFLYIAGSDLIPELHHGSDVEIKTSVGQFFCILTGVGIMALLVFIE